MPFTLAHPAVVLVTPNTKYLHKPALIIGSMSPDFVYFLAGKPNNGVGHTVLGALWCNLPLCLLVYYLYRYFIQPYFWQNFPRFISFRLRHYPEPHSSSQSLMIFICSCWFGMVTHVVLDAFTHKSSTVVKHSHWLKVAVGQEGLSLPIYKWFQYGGGILGLMLIGGYMLLSAYRYPVSHSISLFEKSRYWASVSAMFVLIMVFWQYVSPISWNLWQNAHATLVLAIIRMVNCGALSLLLIGVIQRIKNHSTFAPEMA